MLSLLLDRSDSNAPNQAARFSYHVRELKEYITHNRLIHLEDCLTVDAPIPYSIEDLISRLHDDDQGMKKVLIIKK